MKHIVTLLFCFFLGCGLYAQESISFIKSDNSWHFIYDENGRKVTTLSKSYVGEVIAVSGTTFTCQSGSWLCIFDRNGKKTQNHVG